MGVRLSGTPSSCRLGACLWARTNTALGLIAAVVRWVIQPLQAEPTVGPIVGVVGHHPTVRYVGELEKLVPASAARVRSISVIDATVEVQLTGKLVSNRVPFSLGGTTVGFWPKKHKRQVTHL